MCKFGSSFKCFALLWGLHYRAMLCLPPLFCPRMVPLVRAHMPFLNGRSGSSRRRGGLACAVLIHGGRLLGLLPGSLISGGSGSAAATSAAFVDRVLRADRAAAFEVPRSRKPHSRFPRYYYCNPNHGRRHTQYRSRSQGRRGEDPSFLSSFYRY